MVVTFHSQTKEFPKQSNSSKRFDPLKYVDTEALTGLILARSKSNLKMGELLKASWRSHARSSLPATKTPPDTNLTLSVELSFLRLNRGIGLSYLGMFFFLQHNKSMMIKQSET